MIKYTATEKLAEISGSNNRGINIDMFDVSIVNHTFKNGVGIIEFDGDILTIKNGSIGPSIGAFFNCSSLTSVTFPNSVTSIGSSAFSGCTSLTSVTIPNSVTSIGDHAFSGCSGLTSVTIPNSVTSIGSDAFEYCSNLTSIVVSNGNTNYDSRDNCNAIIETATNKLIVGCKNTVIPNSVTIIGGSAFYKCSGLISVEIPNSVTSIDYSAFNSCTGLTSITILNGVTNISSIAFDRCSNLTSITLPESLTSIGYACFIRCSNLESVTVLPTTPPSMTGASYYGGIFNNTSADLVIYVPAESVDVYKSATGWSTYANKIQAIP